MATRVRRDTARPARGGHRRLRVRDHGYTVHRALGGNEALARLRERLRKRGLQLMLDFVPNHMGLDHPWVENHPEYYIAGTEQDLALRPENYILVKRHAGDLLFAYGRDPYFPGWPDTLQLNYGNPATQEAMIGELVKIAGQCDGVRCDMAMLVLPEIFERTWGSVRRPSGRRRPSECASGFPTSCFMAEVYWDLEWTLQQQGFDYTYDKRLYDRLRDRHARPVREHLHAGLDYQDNLARFLENHDYLCTALHWAVFRSDKEMVDLLLGAGANAKGREPRWRHAPVAGERERRFRHRREALLTAGADANERLPLGRTPLMAAARTGNVDAMKVLLDHGADLNAKETLRGTTALMWAADEGHAAAIQLLIEHGADIKARRLRRSVGKGRGSENPTIRGKCRAQAEAMAAGKALDLASLPPSRVKRQEPAGRGTRGAA